MSSYQCAAEPAVRFDFLVRPHVPDMLRRARSFMKSHDLAWDVVQDTLLALWRNDRLPDESRGVLLSIVGPKSLAALRSHRRRSTRERIACTVCGDDHPDPLQRITRAERLSTVRAALAELPAELRAPIELRAFHDLDYAQIAERLALPLGTVRSRIHRAKERLAHLLAAHDLEVDA